MRKFLFWIGIAIDLACFTFSFLAGVWISDQHYKTQMAEYIASAQKERAQELEALKKREQALSQKVVQAYSGAVKEKDEIKKRFDLYVAELSASDGVHNSSTSDNKSLSNSTATPAGTYGRSSCECNGKDTRATKRALMVLSKEHDELAVRFNTLLEIYQHAQGVMNDGSRAERKQEKD